MRTTAGDGLRAAAFMEVTMQYRLDVVKNGGDDSDGQGGNPPTGDSDDGRQYNR